MGVEPAPAPKPGISRRSFLRRVGIGAATAFVIADAGLAYRAYDQGVLSEGRGPAFDPLRAWPGLRGPEAVVGAAILAANAHNSQPWRFVVLTNRASKERLAEAMGNAFLQDLRSEGLPETECQKRVQRSMQRTVEAPCVVLLCLDGRTSQAGERRLDLEHWMAVQSVALAGGQMLLAAHAEGLGGVWMCGPLFAPEEVRTSLGLPDSWQPQGMILLGYPAGEVEHPARLPMSDVVVIL